MSPVIRTRWVTFDSIGSLIDWQGAFADAVGRLVRHRRDEFLRIYRDVESVVMRRRPHVSYKDVIVSGVTTAAGRTGVSLGSRDELDALVSWQSARPYDDADALMAGLRARGYRLAALADCDDDQFERAHRMLREPFDLFLTAERLRVYKPSPLPFRAFQMMTGAQGRDWVHVGSIWERDLAPSVALGLGSVWLDRSRRAEGAGSPACARVSSGLEALHAIERLLDPIEALAI